ncbi:hypothetical protein ACI3EY_06210 [Ornithinimicrobium sp. LYQ92]|uniref:hypothetical protein n=1 Tax=Serinicoccus sp. LYQ92 TaxID=3378798 RepID=UPI0038524B62
MLRVILLALLVVGVLLALRAAARPPRGADDGGAAAPSLPRPQPSADVPQDIPPSASFASRRHTEAVAAAREELQHAEAAHARALRAAEHRFDGAGLDLPVMTLAGWRLGRLTLVVGDRRHWLTDGTRARVEVVGEIRWRSVLDEENRPRMVPEDERQVRLVVADGGWEHVLGLPGDQLGQAQQFAAATGSTVSTLAEAGSDRQRRIAVALAELEAARADTEELDRARMTLEDLEGAGPLRRDLPPAPEGGHDDGYDDGGHDDGHDGWPRGGDRP